MTTDKHRLGLENLMKIDGVAAQTVVDSLGDIAPGLVDYMIECVFGTIYAREGLSFREREIVTLSSMLSQGDTHPQLIVHIHAALNVGLTKEEIIEVFIQCVPFVGLPKVLNAITTAREVFESRPV
ncbi:MAG: carboxymuconolactone decarboxylase family protein [Streptococcaceae bacterium]|jgi:4-carboxymuconolactone decarboxylase|nr:carboxymuconolactone decarboxylase family protein [Streptococcaceae bacterium]